MDVGLTTKGIDAERALVHPQLHTVEWKIIDGLALEQTRHPNPWHLNIYTDICDVSTMQTLAPYLRSQMPLMQSRGRLTIYWGPAGIAGGWERAVISENSLC